MNTWPLVNSTVAQSSWAHSSGLKLSRDICWNWTCTDRFAPLRPYLLFIQPWKKKKAMNVVCFNSASPFISLAEKQKEKICTGIHLITQEVFGWGNGLVSHKLWTSSPQRSQRRYQSIVFALARTHTANTRCEKQGSETHTHTDGEPCLSVAQSLC